MMSDYTVKKLELNTKEDNENIEAIKQKLQTLDLANKKML
jgi:hypothetical protein